MNKMLNENLLYKIYSILEEIPEGYVTTYGDIAKMIGKDNCSRLIGKALKMSYLYGDFPCHRVVNHQGRLVPGWFEQEYLLKKEGISFKNNFVDLKKHRWKI